MVEEKNNTPVSYLYNNYGVKFYHIIFKEHSVKEKKCDCVVNFTEDDQSKFKVISGCVHYVLRIGGYNERQIFIENNRNPNDNSFVEIKKSQGKSQGKVFMEQYFDPDEWLDFCDNANKVFREVLRLNDQVGDVSERQFSQIVNGVWRFGS